MHGLRPFRALSKHEIELTSATKRAARLSAEHGALSPMHFYQWVCEQPYAQPPYLADRAYGDDKVKHHISILPLTLTSQSRFLMISEAVVSDFRCCCVRLSKATTRVRRLCKQAAYSDKDMDWNILSLIVCAKGKIGTIRALNSGFTYPDLIRHLFSC
jgi:hypothetical protein